MSGVSQSEISIILKAQNQASAVLSQVHGDIQKMSAGMAKAGQDAGGFGKAMQSGLGMGAGFGIVGKGIELIGSAFGAAKGSIIDLNGSLEQSKIAFTTMLGSAENADAMLGDLQKFAAATPFEFPDLVTASKKMLAFGFESKNVVPLLTAVGDAVAAVGGGSEVIDGVTTAIGQMQAKGKVSAEEMGQLAERGIPAWDMLAKHMGVSVAEAMDAVSKGQVKAGTFVEAFQKGSAERFGGMMEKQSATWSGAMSTIKDTLSMATATAFQPFFKLISEGALALSGFLQSNTFTAWAASAASAISTAVDVIRALMSYFTGDGGMVSTMTLMSVLGPQVGVAVATAALAIKGAFDAVMDVLPGVIGLIQNLWDVFSGGDSFDAAAEALDTVFGPATTDMILEFVAIAGDAFRAVADFALQYVGTIVAFFQDNWPLILRTVQTVLNAIAAFWQQHGAAIVTTVKSAWTILTTIISGALDVLLSAMKVGMQLINGDWRGAWETFSELAGRTLERIGTIIGAAFDAYYALIDTATGGMLTSISTWMDNTGKAISDGMRAVETTISDGWEAAKSAVEGILPTIARAIMAVWNALPEDIRTDLVKIAQAIVTAGGTWVTNLTTAGSNMLEAIGTSLTNMVTAVTTWATSTFLAPITGLATSAGSAATEVGSGMLTAITGKLGEAVSAVTTWANSTFLAPIQGLVSTARGAAESIGSAIVNGIISGVRSMGDALSGVLGSMVRGALNAAKATLGIESPSKVFRDQVGKPIVQGVMQGLDVMARPLDRALVSLVQPVSMAGVGGGAAASGSSTMQTVRVDVAISGHIAEAIYIQGRELAVRHGRGN